jgi:aspartate-semialdehyde dehydrogenase
MKKPVIAIVGATGLVGSEMLTVTEGRNVPYSEVRLLASSASVGEVYSFHGSELEVAELTADSFKGVDFALFASSAEISAKFVPIASESGAISIDNSSHFRLHPDVPLVVPEVNGDLLRAKPKIVANPNCSTIQLVPVLAALDKLAGLKHVVVSTYQSVSGAGKAAIDELWSQTVAVCNSKGFDPEVFQHQIAFNCIPQIDVVLEDGYTKEEYKIIHESRKILRLPDLRITATAVRVPVFFGHAESVFVETEREVSVAEFKANLEARAKELGLVTHSAIDSYPLQIDVAGQDEIHVGRIRRDISVDNGLSLWIVADNVRKGAALNAVQIMEAMITGE